MPLSYRVVILSNAKDLCARSGVHGFFATLKNDSYFFSARAAMSLR